MARDETIRILLVEDDEDDFLLTQSMLRASGRGKFELEWTQSYDAALTAIAGAHHDLFLVDYRLDGHTGLDLVRDAWGSDPPAPVILLTGQDDRQVDLAATELGVTDYLVKGTIDAPSLERAVRYAVHHHQAMVDLRRSEERYAVAVRATNDGIWDWDLTSDSMHFSERWKTLLGHKGSEGQRWETPDAWFTLVHPADASRLRREIDQHLAGHTPYFENEHRIRHADGLWRWVLTRGLTTRNARGEPVRITGSLSDITERRNAEDRLVHGALHDSLTGLPNRALFMDRLAQCGVRLRRDPQYACAVLYIDVDRFKLINDSRNHTAGDRLLVELARRVRGVLRAGDTLARLGGDEFTILLDGIASASDAVDVAARAERAIVAPITLDSDDLSIVASIGIAHSLDGVEEVEELVRNADIAMYDAKAHGGGRHQLFDASMHRRVLDRMSLETQLRQAIEQQRLRVFFQPIVELRSGALHGVEALARWPECEREVPPGDFIPVAEEAGLIGALGALILRRACTTLSEWRERQLVEPEVTVSVNVSVRQITDASLVDDVRAALAEAKLPARNLVLEITESTLIERPLLVDGVLRELLDLGVSIQLDDFGTGYSSLTVLHDFLGDTLKIDRTFVKTLLTRPASHAIIRSIVALAHNLGLRVIAEGIERTDQVQALAELGCEYGQGYLFARPLGASDLEALLGEGELSNAARTPAPVSL